MPHLAFYASADDIRSILDFVLEETKCVVYESYSIPDEPLRTFASTADVLGEFGDGSRGLMLMLYAPTMKGAPMVERFELKPGAIPGKSWRERVSGWGLIQMQFGKLRDGKLSPSRTNHNTETRARTWEPTYPELEPVAAWDFQGVTRISRRVNRYIADNLAVRKEGARAVLPGAQALIDTGSVMLGAV